MRRKIVLAGAITGLIGIVVVVGLVLRGSDDQIGVSESPLALDRPEVRTPACPSAAAMVWAGRGWTMTAGPVRLNFPFPVVGPHKEVFALSGRTRPGETFAGALYQKISLNIDAPPGTPFVFKGANYLSGAAMSWDGPDQVSVDVPVSERTFVPGQMVFPGPGCYAVSIEVQGEGYGPFGFIVRSGNPGEIIAAAP